MINEIIAEIKTKLRENAPNLTEKRKNRMYKILNSDNPNFVALGLKVSEIETIIKQTVKDYNWSYDQAVEVFKILMKSNVHDEKFAGFFFLNRFKKEFCAQTVELFYQIFKYYCDSWAVCDSCCIRVIGPFLAKHDDLALRTIEHWSNADNLWNRRAAMVILLKIIMIKKDFDGMYVFNLVEKMLQNPENYIQKAAGWLLKTCSKYGPDTIYEYLLRNKNKFPRLVLRYSSEKLSKERRKEILDK